MSRKQTSKKENNVASVWSFKIDYHNFFRQSVLSINVSQLRKVENSDARLIFRNLRSANVTPLLHFSILATYSGDNRTQAVLALHEEHLWPSLHLTFRPSSPLNSFPVAPLFCIQPCVQKKTPYRVKSSGQRSFSYQAPAIWNGFSVSVRRSTSSVLLNLLNNISLFKNLFLTNNSVHL